MSDQTNVRAVRMQHPDGNCGGVSVDGVSYPPNADGTVTVPTGKPVAELTNLGFVVVEVINSESPPEAA